MLRLIHIGVLVLLASVLVGCPVSQSVLMYNNSGHKVVIELEDGKLGWLPGETLEITDNGAAISWEDLQWVGDPHTEYLPTLVLNFHGKVRTYKLVFGALPSAYTATAKGREFHLQLDEDGKLSLVPSGSKFPVIDDSLKLPVEELSRDDLQRIGRQ